MDILQALSSILLVICVLILVIFVWVLYQARASLINLVKVIIRVYKRNLEDDRRKLWDNHYTLATDEARTYFEKAEAYPKDLRKRLKALEKYGERHGYTQ